MASIVDNHNGRLCQAGNLYALESLFYSPSPIQFDNVYTVQ